LALFYMEEFPLSSPMSIPFRTPVGLSAQVFPVNASERHGSLHDLS